MSTTSRLGLTDLNEGQKGAAAKVNTNQDILDALVQGHVVNGTPPVAPPVSGVEEGHTYIVPASATGDWAVAGASENDLATWNSGWVFRTPRKGYRVWDETNQRMVIWLGNAWQPMQVATIPRLLDNTPGVDSGSLEAVLGTGDDATIDNNFTSIAAAFNNLRTEMVKGFAMQADETTKVVDEAIGVTETTVDIKTP